MNIELKDYFAGKALQGILSSSNLSIPTDDSVTLAYHLAEKMLEHKNMLVHQKFVKSSHQVKIDNEQE